MVRVFVEELPFIDSTGRGRIYELLREHKEAGKPVITSQEELPEEIRTIMDL